MVKLSVNTDNFRTSNSCPYYIENTDFSQGDGVYFFRNIMLLVQGRTGLEGVAPSLLERTASQSRTDPAKQEFQANDQNPP